MLYGIGCDLCQIDRVQKLLAGPHGPAFVRRVFGPEEQAALELTLPLPPGRAGQRLAGRAAANFAAKEAFFESSGHRAFRSFCSAGDPGSASAQRPAGIPVLRRQRPMDGPAPAAGPAVPES